MSSLYKCNTCNMKKQPNEFYQYMSGKRRGSISNYCCKLCSGVKRSNISDCVRDRRSKYLKEYYDNNKDIIKARREGYHSEYYKVNRERLSSLGKAWRKANLDKRAASEAKRRANKHNATPSWLTEKQLSDIKSLYKLAKKLERLTGIKYHVDHIIPLKNDNLVCGLHVPWNLQVITSEENLKKYNKLIEDMIYS